MNSEATIQTIKSIDRKSLGASAHPVVRLPPAGVTATKSSGIVRLSTTTPEEGKPVNIQTQIKSYTDARAAKAAVIAGIMEKSAETGESLSAEQETEYNDAKSEIATIDKHLGRLRETEALLATTATRVVPVESSEPPEVAKAATLLRGHESVVAVARKSEPGIQFARLAGLVAGMKGDVEKAAARAKEIFPNEAPLHMALKAMGRFQGDEFIEKAAVAPGNTTDTTWAAPLVQYNNIAEDFISWLRPQTVVGKIAGLRRVPFNIRVPRQISGGAANWVGESQPKPVTSFAFDNVTMRFTKLASICVITQELARFSSPSAEVIIRDSLAGAIIQQMDSDFVDPANAGVTDVKPASITNTATPVVASGTGTEANIRYDIQALFAPFIAANLTPATGVWIMSASTALALSLTINALGQPSFPGITMNGGTFWGMPVVVSQAAGLVGASDGAHIVILANAADILIADDGQVTIDASTEASVQMNTTPDAPPTASTVMTSLWAQNLLGLRAERVVNWLKARPQSVQYLTGVHWGGYPS